MRILWSLFVLFATFSAVANQGYYRAPDIHGKTLVFTAEGDIWKASVGKGEAVRLTTSPQEELDAAISPNGKFVAFTANYQGTTEAYVMPLSGGLAERVTFENSSVRLMGWINDDELLIASDNLIGPVRSWVLKRVSVKNKQANTLPLADATEGVMNTSGDTLYFIRYGLNTFSDNAKVYRGGLKAELWSWKVGSKKEATRLLADHVGDIRELNFAHGKLYFTSDANGNRNVWQYDPNTNQATVQTTYQNWQVRGLSVSDEAAVFQLGADLVSLPFEKDTTRLDSDSANTLSISLASDFPYLRENWVTQPLDYLTSVALEGKHKKAVLTARGRIAVASVDEARLVQVATPPSSRSRKAVASPDGKWIYALNDSSGEIEIWRFSANGTEQRKQLTTDGKHFRYDLHISPDGQWIAHDDAQGTLWLLNTKTGRNKAIVSEKVGVQPFGGVTWSADSQWLAFSQSDRSGLRQRVGIYSIQNNQWKWLTSDKYPSYQPAFDASGEWLYFLSERSFKATPSAPWGDRNMGPMFDRKVQVFAYPLKLGVSFPFNESNELAKTKNDKGETKNKKQKLSFKAIGKEFWEVPIESGNYRTLAVAENHVFLVDVIAGSNNGGTLNAFNFENQPSLKKVTDNVTDVELSSDKKQLLVQKGKGKSTQLLIIDAKDSFPTDTKDALVKTQAWKFVTQPKAEWAQIFHDAWLMHREFLFDPDLRGVDWNQVKAKYQPLLDRITDRHELNDIFKQMMGELNTLHSQVRGGDLPSDPELPNTGHLGAKLVQKDKSVEIAHIYQTEKERPSIASPLARPGVDVKNGDKIVAINGIPVRTVADVVNALRNQSGIQVLMTLKRDKKNHRVIVKPVDRWSDFLLRYDDWTQSNLKKVQTANNEIGYFHLAAMGGNDIANFAREFYSHINKKGLIIDVRNNRGGNIDSWIIEKLLRRAWAFWDGETYSPWTNMQQTFRGHVVVLINQSTYSDGETFSAAIKALNIAPLIGKQTAGAGVWLSDVNRQADNGMARVAQFAQYDIDGEWIVEGRGVSPDIEVHNLPYETFMGKDAQLEKAIDYLTQKLKAEPIPELKAKRFTPNGQPASDIE